MTSVAPLLFEDFVGLINGARFLSVFGQADPLLFSNQAKDAPGFEIGHCCNGNKRKWANQQGQNEPTHPAHPFVAACDGADKLNNYRRCQPPKKKKHSDHQSVTAP